MNGLGKMLSPILRDGGDGRLSFWCPGCNEAHTLSVAGPGAIWGYNGNVDQPTFTPSVLMRSGHFVTGQHGKRCWCDYNSEQIAMGKPTVGFSCQQCHSFVTHGRIQFLGDCSHSLAGQTVALPPFPESRA